MNLYIRGVDRGWPSENICNNLYVSHNYKYREEGGAGGGEFHIHINGCFDVRLEKFLNDLAFEICHALRSKQTNWAFLYRDEHDRFPNMGRHGAYQPQSTRMIRCN